MKSLFVALLYWTGALELIRWLNRHRLVILTYHGVLPDGRGEDQYLSRNFANEKMFRWQMTYLAKRYHCLKLSEAIELLKNGRPLPPYAMTVTFDDGFKNNFTCAFPIMKRLGIPATIFLVTGHVGRGTKQIWTEKVGWLITNTNRKSIALEIDGAPERFYLRSDGKRHAVIRRILVMLKSMPMERRNLVIEQLEKEADVEGAEQGKDADRYGFLDWTEIRETAKSGVEFGAHTVNHAILLTLDEEQRMREIVDSKQHIEEKLGTPCLLFAYPNGTRNDFDTVDKEILKKAGYFCAVTQLPGLNGPSSDLYELKRVNIGRGHTRLLFIAQVSGFWPWLRKIISAVSR